MTDYRYYESRQQLFGELAKPLAYRLEQMLKPPTRDLRNFFYILMAGRGFDVHAMKAYDQAVLPRLAGVANRLRAYAVDFMLHVPIQDWEMQIRFGGSVVSAAMAGSIHGALGPLSNNYVNDIRLDLSDLANLAGEEAAKRFATLAGEVLWADASVRNLAWRLPEAAKRRTVKKANRILPEVAHRARSMYIAGPAFCHMAAITAALVPEYTTLTGTQPELLAKSQWNPPMGLRQTVSRLLLQTNHALDNRAATKFVVRDITGLHASHPVGQLDIARFWGIA